MDIVRIGKISSVNGNFVRVTYPDRMDAVTKEIPLLSNGVYRVPNVGEVVVVLHLDNGASGAVCLGGLAYSNQDYLLSALYSRLESAEARITALEQRVGG